MDIGQKIKRERDKAKWNQKVLANKAGIAPSALSQIENSERYPSTLVIAKLAKALSVSVDYLISDKQNDTLESIIYNNDVRKFFHDFRDLSAENKSVILKTIKHLKTKKIE
ncbi:helix-turn-helix transcriptional regulator [bacterium]|nr:helix-turn-helix transcriptional regulator [bacterium]